MRILTCKHRVAFLLLTLFPLFSSSLYAAQEAYQKPQQDDEGYFLISNSSELRWFFENIEVWDDVKKCYPNSKGKLVADIVDNENVLERVAKGDVDSLKKWNFNNKFSGHFDGCGHTISGVYGCECPGLFYNIENARIESFRLIDSYFEGSQFVGGVVCRSAGSKVNSVDFRGTVKCKKSLTTTHFGGLLGTFSENSIANRLSFVGTVILEGNSPTNFYYIGGLAGSVSNSIISNSCTCCKIEYSYSESTKFYLGGFSGRMYGESPQLTNCFSYSNVEGFVKKNDSGSINNCYWLSNGSDAKTKEQFSSGEICYLLNENAGSPIFGQNIGVDDCPSFDAKPVVKIHYNDNDVYANGVQNLDLKDGCDFSASANFHADFASYSRESVSNWGSLCLPFSFHTDNSNSPVFAVNSLSDDMVVLTQLHGDVDAGQPVLFYLKSSSLKISASDVDVVASPKVDDLLVGMFESKQIDNPSAYYIKDNKLFKVGSYVNVNAFRSYLLPSDAFSAMYSSLGFSFDGTTGVDDSFADADGVVSVFDMAGRPADSLEKGKVYVARLGNGKSLKMVVK